ncbi:MAG: hypothetical protein HY608_10705 [Planctomycetes bacterium]|nr:hypothetical protein [Planctomycetota bacterium]
MSDPSTRAGSGGAPDAPPSAAGGSGPAGSAAGAQGEPRPRRWAIAALWLYVASLAWVTVNEIFCLDSLDVLTPELHRWVYRLVDVHRSDVMSISALSDLRAVAQTLRDTLARTRYERVPSPDSLEVRIDLFLEKGRFNHPEDVAFVKGAVAQARDIARERLLDIEEFATLPILIRWTMKDPDPAIRRLASDLVFEISEKWAEGSNWDLSYRADRFGYDPDADRSARETARRKWVAWLKTLDLPYKGIIL